MRPRKRSFRRSLVTNLVLVVLVIGVTVAGFAFLALREATRRGAEAIMASAVSAIAANNTDFYRTLEKVFVLVEFWSRRTWNGGWDTYEFDKTFPPLLMAYYEASSLYLALESGDFYLLSREGGQWTSWTVRPLAWGDRVLVRRWSDGDPLPEEHWENRAFDVTALDWYTGALALLAQQGPDAPLARRVFAADPRLSPATGQPGRALSFATKTQLGDAMVFGFERSLTVLSDSMRGLRLLDDGMVAGLFGNPLSEASLLLTGVPARDGAGREVPPGPYLLRPAAALGGPVADLVARLFRNGRFASGVPVRFTSGGEAWWGMAQQLEEAVFDVTALSPSWIVAAVPEADLRRRLPDLTLPLAAAVLVALLLALWRAVALASQYGQPIDHLVEQSRRMQRLDFERPTLIDTPIVEIDILGGTLEAMRRALRSYASISEEVRIADTITRASLPLELARPPGFELEASWRPAEDTGGELFDVVASGADRVDLLLLAPEGFGVEAAVLSAQLRAVFRAALRGGAEPAAILLQLELCLCRDLRDSRPVRAWLGRLDAARGTLTCLAAGLEANAVLLEPGQAAVRTLAGDGPPLAAHGAAVLRRPVTVELAPGATLAVVSNGVIDALDLDRRRFGLERMAATLAEPPAAVAADLLERLERAIERFVGDRSRLQDRTILLLRRLPAPVSASGGPTSDGLASEGSDAGGAVAVPAAQELA